MKNRFLLMGLGNILLRDEGAGVRTVEALQRAYDFPEDLEIVDGGTLGLDLLPSLEGKEKVLFIDAVDFQGTPGTIAIWKDDEIPSFLGPALSFHQVGLRDILFAAKLMGIMPAEVVLLGIQPGVIETGLALSPALEENFAGILDALADRLREWGVQIRRKSLPEEAHVPGCSL